MRVAYNDWGDRAGFRGYVKFDIFTLTHTHTHTHTTQIHTHTHTPWEDQCERHRMTRTTGPDCDVCAI